MFTAVRYAVFATFIASLAGHFVYSADAVVCDHSHFGLPNGLVSTEWNMPKGAMESLVKQSRLPPVGGKQYFACPNTFAALTFTPKDGFRFVVLPQTWATFRPMRVSRAELAIRVMNLRDIEALLDSPSVAMGSVSVRIMAPARHGVSGDPLVVDDNSPSPLKLNVETRESAIAGEKFFLRARVTNPTSTVHEGVAVSFAPGPSEVAAATLGVEKLDGNFVWKIGKLEAGQAISFETQVTFPIDAVGKTPELTWAILERSGRQRTQTVQITVNKSN